MLKWYKKNSIKMHIVDFNIVIIPNNLSSIDQNRQIWLLFTVWYLIEGFLGKKL